MLKMRSMAVVALILTLSACGRPIGEAATAEASPALVEPLASAPSKTAGALPTPTLPPPLTDTAGAPIIVAGATTFTPTPTPMDWTPPPGGVPSATPVGPLFAPPSDGAPEPQILSFEVTPEDQLSVGQVATVRWNVKAQTAVIRYDYKVSPMGADPVTGGEGFVVDALSGSREIALRPVEGAYYVQFIIQAMNGGYDPQTGQHINPKETIQIIQIRMTPCPHAWFFTPEPTWCADRPPTPTDAIIQAFDGGTLIAIKNPGPTLSNTVYVLSSPHGFWTSYAMSQPLELDPLLRAPAGKFLPDPAFYGVWSTAGYDVAGMLKDSIGWATGAATHYQAAAQCEVYPNYFNNTRCFIGAPDGRTILLSILPAYGRNGISWSYWEGEP